MVHVITPNAAKRAYKMVKLFVIIYAIHRGEGMTQMLESVTFQFLDSMHLSNFKEIISFSKIMSRNLEHWC